MLNILKIELKRSLFNKIMLSILIIGLLIHILSAIYVLKGHFYLIDPNFHPETTHIEDLKGIYWDEDAIKSRIKMTFNRYKVWYDGIWNYMVFIPILACMPYACSYFLDRRSGFFNFINVRVKNKYYLYSKLISNAIAGGISVSIPTLIYGLLIITFMKYEPTANLQVIPSGPLSHLFKTNPNIYILFFVFMEFLAGAMYATMGMAISSFIKKKVVIVLSPLIIDKIQSIIFDMFHLNHFAYFIMIGFHVLDLRITNVIIILTMTLVLSSTMFILRGRKEYANG